MTSLPPPGENGGPPGSSKAWVGAALAVSLYFALLLAPLLMGAVEPRWDARDMIYPAFAYTADSVREGRFPLWDPYSNCGYPVYAEPGHPASSPAALLLGWAVPDAAIGFVVYWAVHWWWAAMGMMALARHLGAGPAGGAAAAASFALSGFFVGHAQHTPFIVTAAWLPWVFWLADRAVSGRQPGYALLAGAALGASALGGYPGLVTFTGLALGLWLAFRFLPSPTGGESPEEASRGGTALRILLVLALVGVVSIAVWSPFLHAFFTEGSAFADRAAPLSPENANFDSPFRVRALLTLFFPYAGIAGTGWIDPDPAMPDGYAGVLALPLAALWFHRARGKKGTRAWWLPAFFLFMLLVSLGGHAGVRTALYYLYPPLRYMRFSAPFRLYWILPLSLAAGLGLTRLAGSAVERRIALKLLLGWFAVALLVGLALSAALSSGPPSAGIPGPRLFLPAAIILPAASLLLWRWPGQGPDGRGSRLASLFLAALFMADMAGHLGNNAATAWIQRDSMRQAESFRRRSTIVPGEPGGRLPPHPYGWFNAHEVTKEPAVQGYITMKSIGFDELLCRSRFVEVMRTPLRFWVSPGVERPASREAAVAVLAGVGAGDPVPAFAEGVTADLPAGRAVPGSFGRTRVLHYSPEEVRLEAEVPAAGGFLASTERYAPGWKVWVDGVPEKVVPVNVFFRGVALPPGRHAVVWRYEPALWRPLLVLGALTFAIAVAGGIIWVWRTGRRGSRAGTGKTRPPGATP